MNYQRNAIFAIALLGLLVLSACATSDENLAGGAIQPSQREPLTKQGVLNMFRDNCVIYSVTTPDPNRLVTGNDICREREAGTCVLTIPYERLNDALSDSGAGYPGTGLDVVQSCSWGPQKSDETVAYCCRV